MIVDLHTHYVRFSTDFTQPFFQDLERCGISKSTWDYGEEDYLTGTAKADKAVVFGLRGKKTGWKADNKRVADFVTKHREKYIFFTSIDPGEPGFMEQLEEDHKVYGCKGVKLGPVYQGFHPHAPEYYQIYEYCEKNGLPILTHMATTFSSGVPLEYARPVHMDRVACDFPKLKIVMAHLGHPWEGECIAAIRHQPNLYADISALYYRPWQFYQSMRLLEEYGAGNKVFFGSDFPATTTEDSIKGIRGVNDIVKGTGLPPISDALIETILYSNPLRELGIEQGRAG